MQVSPALRPQRIRTRVPNDPSSPNSQVPGVGPKPRSKYRGSADVMLGAACVRRARGPARRFRHQTGYGCNQAQTTRGEAVAGARGFRHRAGACESHSQGRRRSAGELIMLTRYSRSTSKGTTLGARLRGDDAIDMAVGDATQASSITAGASDTPERVSSSASRRRPTRCGRAPWRYARCTSGACVGRAASAQWRHAGPGAGQPIDRTTDMPVQAAPFDPFGRPCRALGWMD